MVATASLPHAAFDLEDGLAPEDLGCCKSLAVYCMYVLTYLNTLFLLVILYQNSHCQMWTTEQPGSGLSDH